ncbi:MAG: hypothetical protein JXA67_01520, partial [Micromonosporaceae bacterium]|nr:hypothetical protein [Micromonosporaceae bacterium]
MSPSARRATAESVNVIGHDVRLSGVGPVATLTLRRPTASVPGRPGPPIADVPAGPLPAADLLEMLYAFERDLTGDVQVVVIDGDTSAFAAGLGPELGPGGAAGTSPLGTSDQISQAQETVSWLRRPDLVSIAVVRGPVRGVGLQVVLACDLRVLARDDAQ